MSELVEASSICEDLQNAPDLMASCVLRPEHLHNLLSDLIILESPNSTDLPLSQRTVTLAHASVQDFLIGSKTIEEVHIAKKPLFARLYGDAEAVDVRLGEACLAFLFSYNVLGVDLGIHPFLQYAWYHWGEHLQNESEQLETAGQDFFRSQAIKMFQGFAHQPSKHLHWLVEGDYNPSPNSPGVSKLLEALDTPYFYADFENFQPKPESDRFAERHGYQYQPLEDPGYEVRLVEILPRLSDEHPTLCRIDTFTLTEAPPFDAVSYLWGYPYQRYIVYLNGMPFVLADHLSKIAESLKYRSETKGGHLWMDVMCINQSNDMERSHQVRIMADIFASARQVLVAFRDVEDGDDVGVKNVVRVTKEVMNASRDFQKELRSFVVDPNKHVSQLFRKPYWTRHWIVQEIVVARQPTVLFGDSVLGVDHLEALYGLFHFLIESPMLRTARKSMDSVPDLQLMCAVVHTRHEFWDRGHCDYFELFLRFRNSRATDPRDKFYSLLGLVENSNFDMPVDYSISGREVWIQATVCFIQRYRNLAVLSYHPTTPAPDTYEAWPSWSMRFEGFQYEIASFLAGAPGYEGIFQAGGFTLTSEVLRQFDSANHYRTTTVISLPGTYVARLLKRCTLTTEAWSFERRRNTLLQLDSTQQQSGRPEFDDASARREFRWRTILADQYPPGKRIQDFQCRDWTFPPTTLAQELQLVDTWLDLDTNFLTGRCFFVTEDGCLILGPDTAKVGDEVVILLGGRVPFCLRRKDDSLRHLDDDKGHADNRDYILLGECYVHGIMDGERLRDPDLKILQYNIL